MIKHGNTGAGSFSLVLSVFGLLPCQSVAPIVEVSQLKSHAREAASIQPKEPKQGNLVNHLGSLPSEPPGVEIHFFVSIRWW